MDQGNAASSPTGATTTGFFVAPLNYDQLPFHHPQLMGQVVAPDTSPFLDQFITMHGVTAPVPPFSIAGGGHSPYYPVAVEQHPQDYYMSKQVEEYSEADYMWADREAFLRSSNPR